MTNRDSTVQRIAVHLGRQDLFIDSKTSSSLLLRTITMARKTVVSTSYVLVSQPVDFPAQMPMINFLSKRGVKNMFSWQNCVLIKHRNFKDCISESTGWMVGKYKSTRYIAGLFSIKRLRLLEKGKHRWPNLWSTAADQLMKRSWLINLINLCRFGFLATHTRNAAYYKLLEPYWVWAGNDHKLS